MCVTQESQFSPECSGTVSDEEVGRLNEESSAVEHSTRCPTPNCLTPVPGTDAGNSLQRRFIGRKEVCRQIDGLNLNATDAGLTDCLQFLGSDTSFRRTVLV